MYPLPWAFPALPSVMGLLVGLRVCLTPALTHRTCWRDVAILGYGSHQQSPSNCLCRLCHAGGDPRGAGAVCAPLAQVLLRKEAEALQGCPLRLPGWGAPALSTH